MPTITKCARWSRPRAASLTSRSSLRACLELRRSERADGRLGPRREIALPAPDIDPSPELVADAALDPGQGEAKLLMERDAGVVGEGDPGDDGHEALPLEQMQVSGQQAFAQSAPLHLRRDINAGLDA